MRSRANNSRSDVMTETNPDEERAVRQVIKDWAAAVRARDYDGILANHTPDFVMFDVPSPFESVGLAAYRKTWDLFLGWSSGAPRFEIHDMRVVAGSDVAFAFAEMGCYGPDAEGKTE